MARHSEVFESMFLVPQPATEIVETMDGCQVVRMWDTPVELSNLIIALYDGASVISPPLPVDQLIVLPANFQMKSLKISFTWRVFSALLQRWALQWSNLAAG